jgi:hypothetical protein
MTFLHPSAFFLLPLSALLWYLAHAGEKKSAAWQEKWGLVSSRFAPLHVWLLPLASALLIVALARPVWDPEPVDSKTVGQDTVFLIDVSRSMDTRDVSGSSRLEAVKQAILDLLPEVSGDRVALLAFAGTAVPKCPLTMDYAFFRQSVQLLDTSSTSRGGTLLGDALRTAKKDFSAPGRKLAVWVFTDGGDQESFPVDAAKEFGDAGISLYVWGVGTLAGGEVPERGVSSALNETLLRDVANAVPGGAYYGSDSPLWNLSSAYRAHHHNDTAATSSRVIWKEGSWWLLWPVIALVVLDFSIRIRSVMKRRRPSELHRTRGGSR